jgi:hypothetical protein
MHNGSDVLTLLACVRSRAQRERVPFALSMEFRRDTAASAVRGSGLRALCWLNLRVHGSTRRRLEVREAEHRTVPNAAAHDL